MRGLSKCLNPALDVEPRALYNWGAVQPGTKGYKMEKKELIARLCSLSREVMEKKFCYQRAADCFCGENPVTAGEFQFSPEILAFIETAVRKELAKK